MLVSTSEFQNRRTRKPFSARIRSRWRSAETPESSPCWPPSTSMTIHSR